MGSSEGLANASADVAVQPERRYGAESARGRDARVGKTGALAQRLSVRTLLKSSVMLRFSASLPSDLDVFTTEKAWCSRAENKTWRHGGTRTGLQRDQAVCRRATMKRGGHMRSEAWDNPNEFGGAPRPHSARQALIPCD